MVILFWIVGLFFIGLALPLLRRKVRPNSLYGLRVAETLESEEVWYEANARSARDLLGLGIGTIVLSSVLAGTEWARSDSFVLVGCVALVAGVLWYCARGFRIAKEVKRELESRTTTDFAVRYTAAWCSQNAASVAEFFAENGSLKINEGAPSVGLPAITAAAQAFMTAFPDLVVAMDEIQVEGNGAVYKWTLSGTNSGPDGTGRSVRISGYEEWTFGENGLIATSLGHFDEADYNGQLAAGD